MRASGFGERLAGAAALVPVLEQAVPPARMTALQPAMATTGRAEGMATRTLLLLDARKGRIDP